MKKIDLGQGIGILANLGVILGIVLLVIELNQNNRLMASQASYSRLQNAISAIELVTTDDELGLAMFKDISGQDLSEMEAFLLQYYYGGVFQKWVWEFRQSENGLIGEEDLPVGTWAQALSSRSLMHAIYQDDQFLDRYPVEFVEFLDEHVAKRQAP